MTNLPTPMKPSDSPMTVSGGSSLTEFAATNLEYSKMVALALKFTNKQDWVDQQGKPYLQSSGAEKLITKFGIKISDTRFEREQFDDDEGVHYLYTVYGTASLQNGTSLEVIGTCDTRDKFFGTNKGKFKPIQDVNLANIKKKAYTNFLVNAVTRLLGLRNLDWESLGGIGVTAGTKVEYKNKKETTVVKDQDTKKPYWTSEYQGKTYINAISGNHFSAEFLLGIGMKQGKKEGLFFSYKSDEIENALENKFMEAEEKSDAPADWEV